MAIRAQLRFSGIWGHPKGQKDCHTLKPTDWVVKLNPAPPKRAVLVGGGSTKA